jgi:cytochrome c oxidase subunit IV
MDNDSDPGLRTTADSARAVFLAWERMRLAYNAVLGFVVVLLAGSDLFDPAFYGFLLRAAVLANVCFCLGPVIEGYLSLLGVDRRAARWFVFLPGLLLACLLALAALFSWRLRRID